MKIRERILILEPSGNLWGSERVLLDLLKAMSATDLDIAVCCPPDTPIIKELETIPVRIFPRFIANLHLQGKIARLLALKNLVQVLHEFRPSLLYVNQAGVARIALLAAKLLHIPVVSSVKLVEDIASIEALRASERTLPKIICVSHYILQIFLSHGRVPASQLAMIYDPYLPQCDWEDNISPPLPEHANAFACIARLAPSKGQDVVLHALAFLKEQEVPVKVTFVGSSASGESFEKELLELTKTLAVEDQADWVGTQKDIYAYGSGNIAWICPSRHDPFPRVMLAALDSGSPIIAWVGSGGPAEFIEKSGCGILYESQDGKSLAGAMLQMMQTPHAERLLMIEKGRAWIDQHCHPDIAVRNTLAVWQAATSMQRD